MDTSLISFPERGKWGNAKWRGNASGYVYKALFEQYRPKTFIDPMMGSGTSIEVAKEMGIEAYGLDLHSGFNVLRNSILEAVGKEVDMCVSHPPYHDMIVYSAEVWGSEPHPDDLSRYVSNEDFCEKLQVALLNQREATLPGGYYGMLMGDLRRNGQYSSYQAEMIARLPKSELASVIIKAQHNCVSDSRQYSKLKHPRIMHEYIVLWMKPRSAVSLLMDLSTMAREQAGRLTSIWRSVIKQALISLGGQSSLQDLYQKVEREAPERMKQNKNWQAKVRQVLQMSGDFKPVERGVWQLA